MTTVLSSLAELHVKGRPPPPGKQRKKGEKNKYRRVAVKEKAY
jgi:hypothetical protein